MARLMFPDEGSRLVYRVDGAVLGSAANLAVTLYSDAAGAALADLRTEAGAVVPGSALLVDATSRLPIFQGPDGVDTLYARVSGGPVSPVYARSDDRIDTVKTGAALDAPVQWVAGPGTINNSRRNVEHNNATGGFLEHAYTGLNSAVGSVWAIGVGDGGPTSTNGLLVSMKTGASGGGVVLVNQAGTTGPLMKAEQLSTTAAVQSLRQVNSTGTTAPLVEWIADGVPGAGQKLTRWITGAITGGAFGTLVAEVRADNGIFDVTGPTLRKNGGKVRVQTADPGGGNANLSHVEIEPLADEMRTIMRRTVGASESYFTYAVATQFDKASLRAAGQATSGSEVFVDAVSWAKSGTAPTVGFLGAAPVVRRTLPAAGVVTAADIRQALIDLGLAA